MTPHHVVVRQWRKGLATVRVTIVLGLQIHVCGNCHRRLLRPRAKRVLKTPVLASLSGSFPLSPRFFFTSLMRRQNTSRSRNHQKVDPPPYLTDLYMYLVQMYHGHVDAPVVFYAKRTVIVLFLHITSKYMYMFAEHFKFLRIQ